MASEGAQVDYERLRAEKIAQNRAKLAQLGLVEASQALLTTARGPSVTLEAGTDTQPRKKRRVAKEAEPVVLEPSRVSSRLRGQAAPSQHQAVAEAQHEAEEEENAGMGRTRKGTARKQLTLDGAVYVAPFTLWSIGVTVWDLGHIHRGAWAHRYWSNSGCLFHHAYPVGYRASKVQFGRTYDMVIEEGPTGPVFKVVDQKTKVTFSGPSPTKPWTDVCLAHKTGQRISGPLFFGFSDIVTQRAIASLYTPEELQAALQGEKVEGAQQSAEERAAKEFCGLEGVGETTAMALAFTTQLGGAQHRSLASLRAWVQESEAHQEQLQEFLASSNEMPEATRMWPAWRYRMVPKILAALCSSGDSDAGGEGRRSAAAGSDGRVGRGRASSRAASADAAAMVVPTERGTDVASLAEETSRAPEGQQGEGPGREPGGGVGEAVLPSHAAGAAAGGQGASRLPKENRHSNKGSDGTTARAKATAAVAAAAAPLRASRRQRKVNSKYDEFLVDAND